MNGGVVSQVFDLTGDSSFTKSTHICHRPTETVSWQTNLWFYHANSLVNIGDSYVHELYRQCITAGKLWTGNCYSAVHESQRLAVKPLKSSDWPSDPLGSCWPSFPSITEWMEMLRKGIDPFARRVLKQPKGDAGFTHVTRRETQENPVLMSKIVSNCIVGIRSTTEVPRKFLGYFRYAQNFLILTHRFNLPIGLVRFLTSVWILNPYSLWLRREVTFKKFLKKVPILLVRQARVRWCAMVDNHTHRASRCTSANQSYSESYSEHDWDSSDLD